MSSARSPPTMSPIVNRVLNPNLKPNLSPVSFGLLRQHRRRPPISPAATAQLPRGQGPRPDHHRVHLVNADAIFLNFLATPFASVVPKQLGGETPGYRQAGWDRAVPVEALDQGRGGDLRQEPGLLACRRSPTSTRSTTGPARTRRAALPYLKGRRARHDGRLNPAGRVHRRDHEPRVKRPDRPPHAGRQHYVFTDTQMPSNGPFSNVKVRQAVNYAIDKADILQTNPRRLRRGQLHLPARPASATTPPCNPYPHDVEKAKALMKEAGTKLASRPSSIRTPPIRSADRASIQQTRRDRDQGQHRLRGVRDVPRTHRGTAQGTHLAGSAGSCTTPILRLHRPDPVVRLGGQGRCERGPRPHQVSPR